MKTTEHLPVLQVTDKESEKPLGDIDGHQNMNNDVKIDKIERFAPVSEERYNSFWIVRIISIF